jgi:hypothetical protein
MEALPYEADPFAVESPAPPEKLSIKPLGLLRWLSGAKRSERARRLQDADKAYSVSLKLWEKESVFWGANEAQYNVNQKYIRDNYDILIKADTELLESVITRILSRLDWTRKTAVSVALRKSGTELRLDVDLLPRIEAMPSRVANIVASGRKINIKNKANKALHREYSTYIHGVIFRLVAYCFAALPMCEFVHIKGTCYRVRSRSSAVTKGCLIAVSMDRIGLSNIDFKNIDQLSPIDVIERFNPNYFRS